MKPRPCNQTSSWQKLANITHSIIPTLTELFQRDPARFNALSFHAPGIFADISKQHITPEIFSLLISLAQECAIESKRDDMLNGKAVNTSENRQALHTALRADDHKAPYQQQVQEVLAAMLHYAEQIRQDDHITDIVHIGIGGSDLGPRMAVQALAPFIHANKRFHFVSNIDGFELSSVLQHLTPKKTLFIIVSKTFTTQETLANAHTAKQWFCNLGGTDIAKHFVGITTNIQAATKFGINKIFGFWDWVGGRYSIWSAVGLSLAIAIGKENFLNFLCGAKHMDDHFSQEPIATNVPILLGLTDIWNRNFLQRTSRCVAPYHQGLARFPAYLQQLEMESNGKSVSAQGASLHCDTSGVVWGEAGSNGQHAFFQMLHQGTDIIPVDFILVKNAIYPALPEEAAVQQSLQEQHLTLLMNGLAQSRALMVGKTYEEALDELSHCNATSVLSREELACQKTFHGNRPSTTLLLKQLAPYELGALIALHEHRTFTVGAVWGVNSFDQWGVELGKNIARTLMTIKPNVLKEKLDPSTFALYELLQK